MDNHRIQISLSQQTNKHLSLLGDQEGKRRRIIYY